MATKKAAATAEKETKKTTKTAAKTATKAVKAAEEKAEETKAPAKKDVAEKAPAKKVAPKKTAPKKTAPKKPEPVETKVNFFVEYAGVQVSIEDVVANVKATYGKDAKEIAVYLKPEESKAYFVADGEEKEMDVFFC